MNLTEEQKRAINELVNIIQDAKGVMSWFQGKEFVTGNEYWVKRIDQWQDVAHNDSIRELMQKAEAI